MRYMFIDFPITVTAIPDTADVLTSYDVVGVIGSTYSHQSVAAAHVLGPALVPLVSVYSTSDDLSNKRRFPYFMRTVPPNRSASLTVRHASGSPPVCLSVFLFLLLSLVCG